MTMNDAQKIYSYLISEGYTRETKTLSMAVLGNWTIRQNVDTGEKLSTFIQNFLKCLSWRIAKEIFMPWCRQAKNQ